MISWLIPVYKANPEWLKQSVQSCLDQTSKEEFEIVIVNDGDFELKLPLECDKIRIVSLPTNQGVAKALNAGLAQCNGEWIARIDADDYSLPGRIAKQLKFAKKNDLDAIGAGMSILFPEGTKGDSFPPKFETPEELKKLLENKTVPIFHPTAIIKKQKLVEAKGYPTDFPYAEDFCLWIKGYERNWRLGNVHEPLIAYRSHENQVSLKHNAIQRNSVLAALRRWHEFRPNWMG